ESLIPFLAASPGQGLLFGRASQNAENEWDTTRQCSLSDAVDRRPADVFVVVRVPLYNRAETHNSHVFARFAEALGDQRKLERPWNANYVNAVGGNAILLESFQSAREKRVNNFRIELGGDDCESAGQSRKITFVLGHLN